MELLLVLLDISRELGHLPLLVLVVLSFLVLVRTLAPMSNLLMKACFISSLVVGWERKAVSPLDLLESSEAVLRVLEAFINFSVLARSS